MTDKEKLERIKSLADKMYNAAFNMTTDASLFRKAMDDYRQFIINGYHKEEPVSEDLQEAAMMHFKDVMERKAKTGLETANMTSFKAGAQWQKEKMIKEVVDGKVIARFPLASDPLYNDVKIYLNFTRGLSEGDKVKVIIIKSE